jgi:hypothetical protein
MNSSKLVKAIDYLDQIQGNKKSVFEAAIIVVLANSLKLPTELVNEDDVSVYFNTNCATYIYEELNSINEERPINIETTKVGICNLFRVRLQIAQGTNSIHNVSISKVPYDFIWDTDRFMPPCIQEAIKTNGSLFSTLCNLVSLSL